jgi:hypothetical protein
MIFFGTGIFTFSQKTTRAVGAAVTSNTFAAVRATARRGVTDARDRVFLRMRPSYKIGGASFTKLACWLSNYITCLPRIGDSSRGEAIAFGLVTGAFVTFLRPLGDVSIPSPASNF